VALTTPPCKKFLVTKPHIKMYGSKVLKELYSHGVSKYSSIHLETVIKTMKAFSQDYWQGGRDPASERSKKVRAELHVRYRSYASVAQPFYTRDTLNIVEESWRHTNSILHIVGVGGEMVYGIDWPRQLLINRPQPKNVLFYVHNYPSLLLCHSF
jgi:hypothetical protein